MQGTLFLTWLLSWLRMASALPESTIRPRDPELELYGSYESDRQGAIGDSRYCKYVTDFTPHTMDIQYGIRSLDRDSVFLGIMYAMEWIGFSQDSSNLTVQPPSYNGVQITYTQLESQIFYELEPHIAGNMLHWIGWKMAEANRFVECNGTVQKFGKPYANFTVKVARPSEGSNVEVVKRGQLLQGPPSFNTGVQTRLERGWHSLNETEGIMVQNLITFCGCESLYTWFWDRTGSNVFAGRAYAFDLAVAVQAAESNQHFKGSDALIGLTDLMKWQIEQDAFTKVDGSIFVNGTENISISIGP